MSRRRLSWRRRLLRALAWGAGALPALTLLLVLPLRWLDPPTTSFMLQARASGIGIRQRWLAYEDISPWLAIAVVASEDQKFPAHGGFDLESIREALADQGAPSRGASTISQQVAKNLWLWPGRSWPRKALEAWLTLWVEALWSKRRILEVYLNVAEFGRGVYGAEAAARRFFDKPAADLTLGEAAHLAAVLPSPRRMDPARPSPYVQERAGWIVHQVWGLGGPGYLAGLGDPG